MGEVSRELFAPLNPTGRLKPAADDPAPSGYLVGGALMIPLEVKI